jgi:signal transduction histidine kinase
MLLHAVLAFALAETLVLAAVLWFWADRVAGARLLVLFLLGVSVWVTGNELPNWLGRDTERIAIALVSTAPVVSAIFLHFCVVFCRVPLPRAALLGTYALGGASTLLAQLRSPGHLIFSPPLGWVAVPSTVGLVASIAWVVLGIGGLTVLIGAWARAREPHRSQIAAVTVSCGWGALCLTGYAMSAMQWPGTPWPLFGLPAYSLILVYGILRYRVFVVNEWARRGLVWTLLLALGAVLVALLPLIPLESRWLGGMAVAVSCLALSGPVRRVAERLVFPGGQVSAQDLRAWAAALQPAESMDELARRASDLLRARLGFDVPVQVGAASGEAPAVGVPALHCLRDPKGWRVALIGWDVAPPGPRQVAEIFGSVLADAAARVEQWQSLAARERERQLQERLAELGALAATVAHDIRNPLNIISMAVAGAPADTRGEVAHQVGRIANLASDLLDYAKPWKLSPARFDLADRVRTLASRWPQISLGPGLQEPLPVDADARRVDQALINLFDNASRAVAVEVVGAGRPGQVHVDADVGPDAVQLHVCDNGPGVPAEMRSRLFQPFASRSPEGTGLGLAIVARIAAAHGGSVTLNERAPWATCFTLTLPLQPT